MRAGCASPRADPTPYAHRGEPPHRARSLTIAGCGYGAEPDKRAQFIYLRAGNSSDELVYVQLLRDGKPMRLFPIGAKQGVHIPLAVVEDLFPETKLEVACGAPKGSLGSLVLDIGLLEID